jgi:hypothetical protein
MGNVLLVAILTASVGLLGWTVYAVAVSLLAEPDNSPDAVEHGFHADSPRQS